MYLVQLLVRYEYDSEYVPFENSRHVIWGPDINDLKQFANQWVSECKEGEDRRYFVKLLKPEGTTEIVYYSW